MKSQGNSITEPRFLGGILEILGQELSSLVEVIGLANVDEDIGFRTFVFLDEFGGIILCPFGLVIRSKVARKCLVSKFVSKDLAGRMGTFSPQGHFMGFEMGAKALTLLYFPGLRKNKVNAP